MNGSSPSKGQWSLRGLHKGTFQRILMLAGLPTRYRLRIEGKGRTFQQGDSQMRYVGTA